MINDSERREVARRLKSIRGLDYCKDPRYAVELASDAIGASHSNGYSWDKMLDRLADLIESSGHECVPGECPLNVRHDNDRIDRERLLAIATLMAADSVRSVKQGISVSPVYILHAARNIAEACGETFGSIRNRDLTKWGTSIVPKELVVDRDALLSLADEMESEGLDGWASGPVNVGEFARRIREAVGA